MRYKLIFCLALGIGLPFNTQAATPSVVADIAPVHSLVSQVMVGVGQPSLLIPAEASPHHYSLRPSEAKALSRSNIVFWMGEGYTPWLEKALDNVASSATKVELLAVEGNVSYPYREGATFEADIHDEKEEQENKQHHDDEHNHSEEHNHDGNDPHAWLDPKNAQQWLIHISDVLSQQDPKNAPIYRRNAQQASAKLDILISTTQRKIDQLDNPQFIVFHDAYQYFEKRFGITAAGAISLGDAEDPSPVRIKEIRDTVKKLGVTCVFTEPQFNPRLVKNVFQGTPVSTIGIMDPLGTNVPTGSGHYQILIEKMVNSISQCQ